MDKQVILKVVSLCGSLVTAVAAIMLADCDKKEMENEIFENVMKNVNVMINEGKEVM